MNALASDSPSSPRETNRYAKVIEVSRRVRWEIERDVIKGRRFDFQDKFLPDGLSRVDRSSLVDANERRLMSQIQGRTYANIFGLVERFINAKILELSRDHWFGDQAALEALVRFSDEELKHQALFRRIEELIDDGMPAGYRAAADPNDIAHAVLGKGSWAVLALTCHIELFTQAHYRQSIESDESLSALYKDVFLFHWREESQHAILDELEWRRIDAQLSEAERDVAVGELIDLVVAVDGILQAQAAADAEYFSAIVSRPVSAGERRTLEAEILAAYRWQYIVSGVQGPRFLSVLAELLNPAQRERIANALAPLVAAV
ncbi:hypothetical protein [Arenimonas sp.]|uniref:hypothetical protein n=1 Tax=Arenimonas sp. TaxID=1872635 RepID=UPI0039E4AA3B